MCIAVCLSLLLTDTDCCRRIRDLSPFRQQNGDSMFKKFIAAIAASAAVFAGSCFCTLSADAATVHDVAAVARQYGYPEELIQQGYNEYYKNPELYTSEDFEYAIQMLHSAGNQLITTGVQVTTVTTAPTTTTVTTAPSGSTSSTTTTKTPSVGGTSADNSVTVKMPDGSSFTRISRQEFIKMSYNEKMAYIATFTPEQQQAFISDLSADEYRSLLKQAPTDTKADVVEKLSQAMSSMGVHVNIGELSDDKISLNMTDKDGNLLGTANAGVIVEDTGYDRSLIIKTAAALFVLAAGALSVVLLKFSPRKNIGVSDEG